MSWEGKCWLPGMILWSVRISISQWGDKTVKRKTFITIAAATLLVFLIFGTAQAAWFDPSWHYRNRVTVSGSGSALTDYQVKVTLNSSFDFTKAKSDGSDLRVTASDETTLIPFWIEKWDAAGSQATIWAKVPSIPAGGTTIYVYYGNSASTSTSDGTSTFVLFDDTWSLPIVTLNPVMTAHQPWWEVDVSYPMVFEDTSFAGRPRYHMLYDGHHNPTYGHSKGYATSPDLINWTEYDGGSPHPPTPNAIMGPAGYAGSAEFAWGDTIKVGSTYHMFVSQGPGTVVHAQSTDLITWTSSTGSTTTFDSLTTDDPGGMGTGEAILKQADGITPIVVDNKYWMVYAHGFSGGPMYLAYTDAASNLLTWTTANNKNPILTPTGWEGSGLWTPSFVEVNNTYYIYYQGGSWQIGFASAPALSGGNPVRPDNVAWTKSASNPVITNTHGWDSAWCQDPVLRYFGGTFYLFYTGQAADGLWKNGFATSTSPEGPWTQYGATGGGATWTTGGNPTVSNGIISLHGGSGPGDSIQSLSSYSPGSALGYRALFRPSSSKYKWGGFISGILPPFIYIGTAGDGPNPNDLILTTYHMPSGPRNVSSLGTPTGAFHTYEITWLGSVVRAYIDHSSTPAGSLTADVPSGPLPIQFQNYNDTGPTQTLDLDWVYLRQYREPEPAASVGAEQSLSPPAAPLATAATDISTTGFTANWSASTGATSYRLDVATDSSFVGILPAYSNFTVSGLFQAVSGMSPGTDYYYRVRAVNAGGPSDNSNTIAVTTTFSINTPVTLHPSNIVLTFSQATSSCIFNASATSISPPGPASSGYHLISVYDITSCAGYTGPVTVTIPYSQSSLPSGKEGTLRIFHWESGAWHDVTVSVDTANNTITGRVTSLSPFGMGYDHPVVLAV